MSYLRLEPLENEEAARCGEWSTRLELNQRQLDVINWSTKTERRATHATNRCMHRGG